MLFVVSIGDVCFTGLLKREKYNCMSETERLEAREYATAKLMIRNIKLTHLWF